MIVCVLSDVMTTPPWWRKKVMVYYYYHYYICDQGSQVAADGGCERDVVHRMNEEY